jgi:hypothetical protein
MSSTLPVHKLFELEDRKNDAGSFEILGYESGITRQKWLEMWNAWPGREVFAHPEYVKLLAGPGDCVVCAAMGTRDGGGILFPLILRPLCAELWAKSAGNIFDAVSPYGYGGAFAWRCNDEDAKQFWTHWNRWITEKQIVASFARLSLFPDQILAFPGNIEFKQSNVVRSLDLDEDALWRDYAHKVRKNVKRALQEGVQIEYDDCGARINEFVRIYHETMDRKSALSGYYFPESFFREMIAKLSGSFAFFHAIKSGVLVSTELVLLSEFHMYSFLGGTVAEAFRFRPNDLIKHSIINWGRRNGRKSFVLGGGYEGLDGIYRYKLSFAPGGDVAFYVGTQIHDASLYEQLVRAREEWELLQGNAWNPTPGYFPKYRA